MKDVFGSTQMGEGVADEGKMTCLDGIKKLTIGGEDNYTLYIKVQLINNYLPRIVI